jgi:uncharacterized membrane protein
VNALTVWRFGRPDGAEQALTMLQELAKRHLVRALTTQRSCRGQRAVRSLGPATSAASPARSRWRGLWGSLFGLLLIVPLWGLAFGAAAGALAGSLPDYGIDGDFIKEVRGKVTRSTSALRTAVVDRLAPGFRGVRHGADAVVPSPEQTRGHERRWARKRKPRLRQSPENSPVREAYAP